MPRLRFDVLANALGQGWAVLIGLLFVPFFLQQLGVERFAVIALVPVAAALLQVMDLGLAVTLNRELARQAGAASESARSTAFTLFLAHLAIGAVVCAAALAVAATLGPAWLDEPDTIAASELAQGVLLLAVLVALQWPLPLFQNGLMGLGRQARVNALVALNATVANVGAALLVSLGHATLPAYLGWFAVCAALHSVAAGWLLWRSLPPAATAARFDRATLTRVGRFSGGAAGINLTGVLLMHADRLIASRLLTLEQFGYYGLATTIGRSVYLLIAPVYSAVFPRLAGLVAQKSRTELANLYSAASQLMAFAIAPPAAVIFWLGFDAAYAWLGSTSTATAVAGLAAALILGSALNGLMNLPYALQLAFGITRVGLGIYVLLLVLTVPAAYALQAGFGAAGVASTWLVINVMYFAIGVPVTHRVTGISSVARWVLRDVLPPVAAAFIGVGMVHAAFGTGATRIGAAVLVAGALATGYACALGAAPTVRGEARKLLHGMWRAGAAPR
jgi:O-antigen/teichoic acid export membrane protein